MRAERVEGRARPTCPPVAGSTAPAPPPHSRGGVLRHVVVQLAGGAGALSEQRRLVALLAPFGCRRVAALSRQLHGGVVGVCQQQVGAARLGPAQPLVAAGRVAHHAAAAGRAVRLQKRHGRESGSEHNRSEHRAKFGLKG